MADQISNAIVYSANGVLVSDPLLTVSPPDGGITQLTGNVTAGPGSGSQVATIAAGVIINSMVNSAAAIAYSKLALTGSIVAGDLTSGSITPAKVSTTSTDDFSFPRDVTIGRDLSVYPSISGGTCAINIGNTSTATTTMTMKSQAGAQVVFTFNQNGDKWILLAQVDGTFQLVDAANSLIAQTIFPHGGVAPTKLTTTAKNALTGVAGMVVYDTTLNKLCVYTGSAWETVTSA